MKLLTKLIIVMLLAGGAVYFFVSEMNKPTSSVADREADVVVSASLLAAEYAENEETGNEKYLGKILQVSGEIYEIEGGTPLTVVLNGSDMTQVRVEFENAPDQLPAKGEDVTIIGRCSGMLLDVVLNNAALTTPEK